MIVGFWGQKRRLFGAYIKFKISIAYMQLVGPFADERYWHAVRNKVCFFLWLCVVRCCYLGVDFSFCKGFLFNSSIVPCH